MADMFVIGGAVKLGSNKTVQKIIGIVVAFFLLLFVAVIGVIESMFSVFTGSGLSSTKSAKDTQVYIDYREMYDEYVLDVTAEMAKQKEKYHDLHLTYYTETQYDPEKKKNKEVKIYYSAADITTEFNYIPSAYALAYLSIKNSKNYLKKKKVSLDEKELRDFWDTVGGLIVENPPTGEGEWAKYVIHNPVKTPQEIAEYYFDTEEKQKQYLESVYQISMLIGAESWGGIYSDTPNRMGIPLYYQYEKPWGTVKYGSGTISKTGCGPTCIAMVFSYLKNEEITPEDIVAFTGDRYYVKNAGSSWAIFEGCASHWGIQCSSIGTSKDTISHALWTGKPVILSMGPGKFTTSGHFIVLSGIDEDGYVYVNDPNDNQRKNFYKQKFQLSQILSESKGGWSFESY